MTQTFTQTIASYELIQGCWFRTDTSRNTIRVVDQHDFTDDQLPGRQHCDFCNNNVPHSELLHELNLWGE